MQLLAHNVRARPSPFPHSLVAVLVARNQGGVCAYEAILPDRGDGRYDLDWVMRFGAKLSPEEAATHFSDLRRDTYVWP